MVVNAKALPIGGLGNGGTLEVGWAPGFLVIDLSKGKAIVPGFGVHILVFIVCAILGFTRWVTGKPRPVPACGRQRRQGWEASLQK
jgi:cytosine/adenosine deaminase-related metal-dependent hydrolase